MPPRVGRRCLRSSLTSSRGRAMAASPAAPGLALLFGRRLHASDNRRRRFHQGPRTVCQSRYVGRIRPFCVLWILPKWSDPQTPPQVLASQTPWRQNVVGTTPRLPWRGLAADTHFPRLFVFCVLERGSQGFRSLLIIIASVSPVLVLAQAPVLALVVAVLVAAVVAAAAASAVVVQ